MEYRNTGSKAGSWCPKSKGKKGYPFAKLYTPGSIFFFLHKSKRENVLALWALEESIGLYSVKNTQIHMPKEWDTEGPACYHL